jgi:predicted  nucleic acid-binding Zn-ribbon protein
MERLRVAAANHKAAYDKLVGDTKTQFGRLNGELSQARRERDALRSELQQLTSTQSSQHSSTNDEVINLRAHILSLENSLAQMQKDLEEARRTAVAQSVESHHVGISFRSGGTSD